MGLDSRAFRDALGQFSTGVCVVTVVDEEMGPIGMTVNSFSAVSLAPPLVLWSIQKDSERFTPFYGSVGFAVSILSEDQAAMSNRYAQKQNYHLEEDSFHLGRSGEAVLKHCLGSFECKTRERIEAGDHIILIGEVVEMQCDSGARPLLFFGGEYRQLR